MICKYRNISERDMDLLFMEAFATDSDFAAIFINRTGYADQPFLIVHAERSKVDNGLGESDLTVIYEVEGIRHALLIEDKIDAVAMPDQHGRYIKRGNRGVERGEYATFDVFIVCPLKYRETNEEAAKYENFVSYEECRDFFKAKNDPHSRLWYQQISQALETMKAEYKVDLNEIAIDSFQQYAAYQKEYYPRLRLMSHADTKKVNGWWPSYGVGFKGAYIIHKTNFNLVDLTISGAADYLPELGVILKWLHQNGNNHITLEKTGKSAAFRIYTPEIKMSKPFNTWKLGDLNACFDVIQELADLAMMFSVIDRVIFKRGSSD